MIPDDLERAIPEAAHMRVIVTGSRNWADPRPIRYELLNAVSGAPATIVHGDATGADAIADDVANAHGWTVERHPADWITHGKRAGYVRNKEMADAGADLCLAFPLGESKGTRMMIDLAIAAGIPTRVIEATA